MPGMKHAEVHTARDHNLRHASQPYTFEPVRSTIVDGTVHGVKNFVCREVYHSNKLSCFSQFFHGRATDSVRVEDDRLITIFTKSIFECHDSFSRIPQHRDGDITVAWFGWGENMAVFDHPFEGRGHIVKHGGGDGVKTKDIHDGVEDHNVTRS